VRNGIRLKRGFLPDQSRSKHRIEIIFRRFAAQRQLVGKRIERFPCGNGKYRRIPRIEIRNNDAPYAMPAP